MQEKGCEVRHSYLIFSPFFSTSWLSSWAIENNVLISQIGLTLKCRKTILSSRVIFRVKNTVAFCFIIYKERFKWMLFYFRGKSQISFLLQLLVIHMLCH